MRIEEEHKERNDSPNSACSLTAAVYVAVKNKMDLAIGVALGSSIQIAIFVLPFTVGGREGVGIACTQTCTPAHLPYPHPHACMHCPYFTGYYGVGSAAIACLLVEAPAGHLIRNFVTPCPVVPFPYLPCAILCLTCAPPPSSSQVLVGWAIDMPFTLDLDPFAVLMLTGVLALRSSEGSLQGSGCGI